MTSPATTSVDDGDGNKSSPNRPPSTAIAAAGVRLALGALLVITAAVGVTGHGVLLVSVKRTRNIGGSLHVAGFGPTVGSGGLAADGGGRALLANACLAGLLGCAFSLPFYIVNLTGGRLMFDESTCRVVAYFNILLFLALLTTSSAIAVQQCLLLVRPARARYTHRTTAVILAASWAVPVTLTASGTSYLGFNERLLQCLFVTARPDWVPIVIVSLPTFAAVVATGVCYALIVATVHRSRVRLQRFQTSVTSSSSSSSAATSLSAAESMRRAVVEMPAGGDTPKDLPLIVAVRLHDGDAAGARSGKSVRMFEDLPPTDGEGRIQSDGEAHGVRNVGTPDDGAGLDGVPEASPPDSSSVHRVESGTRWHGKNRFRGGWPLPEKAGVKENTGVRAPKSRDDPGVDGDPCLLQPKALRGFRWVRANYQVYRIGSMQPPVVKLLYLGDDFKSYFQNLSGCCTKSLTEENVSAAPHPSST